MTERDMILQFYGEFTRCFVHEFVREFVRRALVRMIREREREEDWLWFTACQERGTALSRGVTDIFCEVVRDHPIVPR